VVLTMSAGSSYPVTTVSDVLSLHDALPIYTGKDALSPRGASAWMDACDTYARVETVFRNKSLRETPLYPTLKVEKLRGDRPQSRSEEHTSELQSREKLVCRLLLDKKKRYAC